MFSHEKGVVVSLVCVTPSWLKSPVKIDLFVAEPESEYVSVVSKSKGIPLALVNDPEAYQTPIIGSSEINSSGIFQPESAWFTQIHPDSLWFTLIHPQFTQIHPD